MTPLMGRLERDGETGPRPHHDHVELAGTCMSRRGEADLPCVSRHIFVPHVSPCPVSELQRDPWLGARRRSVSRADPVSRNLPRNCSCRIRRLGVSARSLSNSIPVHYCSSVPPFASRELRVMMSSVDHAVSWRRQGDGFLSVPHPNLFIKPIPVRRINDSCGFFVTVDGSVRDAGRR